MKNIRADVQEVEEDQRVQKINLKLNSGSVI